MVDLLLWALEHGVTIGLVALFLAIPVVLLGAGSLWFLQGARVIAAGWVWHQAWRWWRSRGRVPFGHPGGAGGRANGYSDDYLTFMESPEWRRQRGRVLGRDRHRCTACGASRGLHAHHLWYAQPVRDTPDWALSTLCEGCHRRAHSQG